MSARVRAARVVRRRLRPQDPEAADRTYVVNSGLVAMSGRSVDLHGTAEFDAAYFGMGATGQGPGGRAT